MVINLPEADRTVRVWSIIAVDNDDMQPHIFHSLGATSSEAKERFTDIPGIEDNFTIVAILPGALEFLDQDSFELCALKVEV